MSKQPTRDLKTKKVRKITNKQKSSIIKKYLQSLAIKNEKN